MKIVFIKTALEYVKCQIHAKKNKNITYGLVALTKKLEHFMSFCCFINTSFA